MKIMKEKKVFSLCADFNEEEFSQIAENLSPDCYIDYTANSEKVLKQQGYENDVVANRLIILGCKEGEEVLIKIDY